MPVISARIRSPKERLRLLRQHRVMMFFRAMDNYADGKTTLDYLFKRYSAMIEIGTPPVRNKRAKRWKR